MTVIQDKETSAHLKKQVKLLLEKSLNRITTGHFRRAGSKNISKEAGRLGRHIWRLENRPNLAGKIDSHWGGNHFMANRWENTRRGAM